MLLWYSNFAGETRYQPSREVIFEFDVKACVASLTTYISHLEKHRSTHRELAVEDQRHTGELRKWLISLENCSIISEDRTLDWQEACSVDYARLRWIVAELVKQGCGICLCPWCNEVYKASDMELHSRTGGGSGGDFVRCPCEHDTGIYSRFYIVEARASYPPARTRVYKIGTGGNHRLISDLPF